MQKKSDKFFDKIVKKNYNNELEEILEKKLFDENVKSFLLNILYKIETAYPDYEKVKQNVEGKEEFLKNIIQIIEKDCNEIKLVKLHSEESKMLGNKTFLVEKNKKRIISYPIERKLLYCISKIDKNELIIKEQYFLINKTLSELINVGDNINKVEPIRDFNGFSWTTIPREIESINHNIAYQNLRILTGYKFLNEWIRNNEYIIDYMQSFKNKLEEQYDETLAKRFVDTLNIISVLLAIRFNTKIKKEIISQKEEIEQKLHEIENNQHFVKITTQEKIKLTQEIKKIDETINNKKNLQEEYDKRNKDLPLEKKIFSIRILSKLMEDERHEKITQIEKLNNLLNPKKFVTYKRELEKKYKYLKLADITDIDKEIKKYMIKLQKIFLECYVKKIEKAQEKQDIIKLIYEFRYYNLIPFDIQKNINDVEEIKEEIEKVEKQLIKKAHDLKAINIFSKDEKLEYTILKNIFNTRVIEIEEIYLKIIKEKDKYFIQLFDDQIYEQKIEIENMGNMGKNSLEVKVGKKIKIFD